MYRYGTFNVYLGTNIATVKVCEATKNTNKTKLGKKKRHKERKPAAAMKGQKYIHRRAMLQSIISNSNTYLALVITLLIETIKHLKSTRNKCRNLNLKV